MAILKALPGSAKVNGKPIKGKLIKIKKSVISIDKFFTKQTDLLKKEREILRKENEKFKRKKKENRLEKPKKEWKKLVPKKVPGLSFFDSIRKFVTTWILGFIAIKLIPLLPKLIPVVLTLGKVVGWFINIGGKFLNGIISFVDFGVKAQEATYGFLRDLGGEKFADSLANFAKGFGRALDAMLLAGIFLIGEAATGDSGLGLISDLIGDGLMKKFFGKSVVSTTGGALATTATTGGGTTAGGGTAGGGAGGVAGGGAAATVAIVAGAGLLSSGLGEGIYQMLQVGKQQESRSFKAFKDKGWWNPMKYIFGAMHLMQKFSNFQMQIVGTILDIVGAPFRYIIELVRYPFLNEKDKKKQRTNLAKFDARIRESFREMVNTLSLGMLAKEKGSFGSMFKQGPDAMGYTQDGKTKSEQVPGKEGTILLGTPNLKATQDFLKGNKTAEQVHKILKIKQGGDATSDETSTNTDGTIFRSNVKDPVSDRISANKGVIIGGALGAAAFGPLGAIAGAAIGKDIQKRGFKGTVGGIADFATFGMFDFDKQNRKGAPKDFGIRRIAGGLADWATMGLTDFDKRGAGTLQFDPMFGGKDKAWGAADEQAKRGEAQSGFGLKRGIGGALDFATLGMFDFDKQNRKGAPKGFGIKRIAGGLADYATLGITDFDQRGAGVMQFDPISGGKDKAWGKEYETPQRILDHRDKVNNLRNMGQFATKDGRTISMYDMLTSGDRSQIEEALYMQRSRERGAGEGYADWVGNPEYEAETLKYLKPSSTSESPIKLGKQPARFNEELLGVSAIYETDGVQKEITIYAPTTQINMLQGDDGGTVEYVNAGTSGSSEDPYEVLEEGG